MPFTAVPPFGYWILKRTKSNLVDPPGIEPGPLPCHGSVIPIYYGPYFIFTIPYFQIFFNKKRPLPEAKVITEDLIFAIMLALFFF